ncbi:uncharacterized protein AMSG_11409 [Thecamonas trahens ATCC 50062]|uniref:Uncharacterized protein n=1 Tax=Thecamonas trahens ATCC 50062 TaxID=461836 RepID=A0A0L0DUM7_THETB|nr:hypothetical protein AMSG_11409 [Thecamonas trahens ATCC 50062]KNC55940.1 hypothetical protein AMSG_11409 [Thecamonas trahens ATCC 50062]|eukprot:XP_013752712.1 hypothetical protein AMSG_11409 [Thecamonas trahens ATCC 50062]
MTSEQQQLLPDEKLARQLRVMLRDEELMAQLPDGGEKLRAKLSEVTLRLEGGGGGGMAVAVSAGKEVDERVVDELAEALKGLDLGSEGMHGLSPKEYRELLESEKAKLAAAEAGGGGTGDASEIVGVVLPDSDWDVLRRGKKAPPRASVTRYISLYEANMLHNAYVAFLQKTYPDRPEIWRRRLGIERPRSSATVYQPKDAMFRNTSLADFASDDDE